MRVPFVLAAIASLVAFAAAPASVSASQVSGAIFTTDSDGSQVNQNNYAAREDVYLNGGPGLNAPPGAAGLPPGKPVRRAGRAASGARRKSAGAH